MARMKHILTFLLGPFLIIGTAALAYYSTLMLPGTHYNTSIRISVFTLAVILISLSLWLSNQKSEQMLIRRYSFFLFWIGAVSAVMIGSFMFWAHASLALTETAFHRLLKYALPSAIVIAALAAGVWRYKKSSNIRLRAGFGSAAVILLVGMYFTDYGWFAYRSAPRPNLKTNTPAPEFSLQLSTGEMVSLHRLRGKIVVLDFWASWCGPCIEGLPALQKVYEKYQHVPDVVFFAVNVWENGTEQRRIAMIDSIRTRLHLTLPVLIGTDDVSMRYRVKGIPTQFYIDTSGVLRHMIIGYSGPEAIEEMTAVIEQLR